MYNESTLSPNEINNHFTMSFDSILLFHEDGAHVLECDMIHVCPNYYLYHEWQSRLVFKKYVMFVGWTGEQFVVYCKIKYCGMVCNKVFIEPDSNMCGYPLIALSF